MTNIEKFFGERLKEIRKQRGFSQAGLAEMVNVDEKYISRLETGTSTPSFAMLVKISKALNIEIETLFKFKHLKNIEDVIRDINTKIRNTSEKNVRLIHKFVESIVD